MENVSHIKPFESMLPWNRVSPSVRQKKNRKKKPYTNPGRHFFSLSRLMDYTHLDLIAKPSATILNTVTSSVNQISENSTDAISINQLAKGPAHETADILRRISTRANQAAELDQTFENRKLLQTKITKDLSNLKTVFEKLSQDDLKLFVALFQNQLPIGPTNTNSDQNPFLTNLSLDRFVENFPTDLFRIDVTSELGSLAALNLTGTAIDILSAGDSGSGLLESLLDNLTYSIFNFSFIESSEPDQDDATTEHDRDIALLLAQSQSFITVPSDSNPLTIIDLVG